MGIEQYLISHFSYLGMILVATIGNLFPGVPEEIFLLTLGYTSGKTGESFILICLLVWLGLLLADTVLYFLSRRGSRITKFIMDKVLGGGYTDDESKMKKHIKKIIFISRFLVQARSIGPIYAGTIKYPYVKFIEIDMLALACYVPLVIGIGRYFEKQVGLFTANVEIVKAIVLIALAFLVFSLVSRRLYAKLRERYIKNSKTPV
jgi:membrane protein DedA with SNARE-associated domain